MHFFISFKTLDYYFNYISWVTFMSLQNAKHPFCSQKEEKVEFFIMGIWLPDVKREVLSQERFPFHHTDLKQLLRGKVYSLKAGC